MKYFVVGYREHDEDSICLGPYISHIEAEIAAEDWWNNIPEAEWKNSSYDIVEKKI